MAQVSKKGNKKRTWGGRYGLRRHAACPDLTSYLRFFSPKLYEIETSAYFRGGHKDPSLNPTSLAVFDAYGNITTEHIDIIIRKDIYNCRMPISPTAVARWLKAKPRGSGYDIEYSSTFNVEQVQACIVTPHIEEGEDIEDAMERALKLKQQLLDLKKTSAPITQYGMLKPPLTPACTASVIVSKYNWNLGRDETDVEYLHQELPLEALRILRETISCEPTCAPVAEKYLETLQAGLDAIAKRKAAKKIKEVA